MNDCIFCKLKNREISAKFLYEDDEVMAFPDIHPMKPVHILVVPKEHIEDFLHVKSNALWGKLFTVAQKMAKDHNLDTKGFRISINGGGAQDVPHLHIHVMGPIGSSVKN